MVEHVLSILVTHSVSVLHLGMAFSAIFVIRKFLSFLSNIIFLLLVEYYHILLASNLTFTTDYYINSLNSPAYQSLTTDISSWLNAAFITLPGSKTYSINFVA